METGSSDIVGVATLLRKEQWAIAFDQGKGFNAGLAQLEKLTLDLRPSPDLVQ